MMTYRIDGGLNPRLVAAAVKRGDFNPVEAEQRELDRLRWIEENRKLRESGTVEVFQVDGLIPPKEAVKALRAGVLREELELARLRENGQPERRRRENRVLTPGEWNRKTAGGAL